jgi:hypothetical protein
MPPTGTFTLHTHSTLHDTTILRTPDGRAVTTLSGSRIQHLFQLFRPDLPHCAFEEEVYHPITRLGSRSEIHSSTPTITTRNIWAAGEDLLTALRSTFHIQTKLYSDPLDKSLYSHIYHSLHPEDTVLSSSGSNAPHTSHRTNIANPEYDHEYMRCAMEHAITRAHATASHSPSASILILPQWEHTPYRHSKDINSPYTHHLYTLTNDANIFLAPDQHTGNPTPPHSAHAGWSTSTSSPTPSHFPPYPRTQP